MRTKPFKSVCTEEEWLEYLEAKGAKRKPKEKPKPKEFTGGRGIYHRSYELKVKIALQRRKYAREQKKLQPKVKKPKPYRPKCKIKAKIKFQDVDFVLACCEAGHGISPILTRGFNPRDHFPVFAARFMEWYCLYRYTRLTHIEIAKMYGAGRLIVDKVIRKYHTMHERGHALKTDGGKYKKLRACSEPIRMMRSTGK